VTHVEDRGAHRRARVAQLLGDAREVVGVDVGEGQRCPRLGEAPRELLADAVGRAGDRDDLAVVVLHDIPP